MDFHEYTSLDQFDQKKIIRLARLDSLPGFSLLPREYEYLNLYRKLLVEAEEAASASRIGFAGQETKEEPAEEPTKEAPKNKKKAKKTEE